jgi:hypothetical protein
MFCKSVGESIRGIRVACLIIFVQTVFLSSATCGVSSSPRLPVLSICYLIYLLLFISYDLSPKIYLLH